MTATHWIRFPNKREHKRAIVALLQVPRLESLGLPGLEMVVEKEHIQALEKAKVNFSYVSESDGNGKIHPALQS